MLLIACVICHKLEAYVDLAIASLVTQTRKPDVILLIGTDLRPETRNAFEHWHDSPHQIPFVLSPKSLTCIESKNFAADVVTNYVTDEGHNIDETAFFTLDADDWLERFFVERCFGYMEGSDADVVGCDYQFAMPTGFYKPCGANERDIARDIIKANPLPSCSIIRLSAFNAIGGYSPETKYEDWCLWIRLHYGGYRLFRYPQILFNYRMHANNISRAYDAFGEMWRTRKYARRVKRGCVTVQGAN